MCICHPFHHWMTIQRARIIIGALALIIFIFAGIVCLHYTIYPTVDQQQITTVPPDLTFVPFNSTADVTLGGGGLSFPPDHSYTAFPFSPGPSYTRDMGQMTVNRSEQVLVQSQNDTTNVVPGTVLRCEIDHAFIDPRFFSFIRYIYPGIFLVSCIIVLVLYSLIYRYVLC